MKELRLCVMLPVTVKIRVRDSFNVGIIVCSKRGGGRKSQDLALVILWACYIVIIHRVLALTKILSNS